MRLLKLIFVSVPTLRLCLGRLVAERPISDREVTGSSLTHCTAECGPAWTPASVTKQFNLPGPTSGRAVMLRSWEGNRKICSRTSQTLWYIHLWAETSITLSV